MPARGKQIRNFVSFDPQPILRDSRQSPTNALAAVATVDEDTSTLCKRCASTIPFTFGRCINRKRFRQKWCLCGRLSPLEIEFRVCRKCFTNDELASSSHSNATDVFELTGHSNYHNIYASTRKYCGDYDEGASSLISTTVSSTTKVPNTTSSSSFPVISAKSHTISNRSTIPLNLTTLITSTSRVNQSSTTPIASPSLTKTNTYQWSNISIKASSLFTPTAFNSSDISISSPSPSRSFFLSQYSLIPSSSASLTLPTPSNFTIPLTMCQPAKTLLSPFILLKVYCLHRQL